MTDFICTTEPVTIKVLEDYIAKLRTSWTKKDEHYLGKIEDHPILVQFPDTGAIGFSKLIYDGALGIILVPSNYGK